jgi:dTDP-glucose 4,6-dehydratase
LEVAKMLLAIFNLDVSYIKFVKDRPGHDRRYAIDWRKLQKLGWKPVYSDLAQGLRQTVGWYRENEWWWRPLKKRAEKLYKKTGQS